MLEILFLIFLTKKIGAICVSKGHSAGGYKTLLVALWFGGEIVGAIVGAVVTQGEGGLLVYAVALLGAAGGAFVSFAVANGLSPKVGVTLGA